MSRNYTMNSEKMRNTNIKSWKLDNILKYNSYTYKNQNFEELWEMFVGDLGFSCCKNFILC